MFIYVYIGSLSLSNKDDDDNDHDDDTFKNCISRLFKTIHIKTIVLYASDHRVICIRS